MEACRLPVRLCHHQRRWTKHVVKFWDVDSAWVSRQRHSLGVLGDIGGPCLCFIVILPVVKPFAAYAMSLVIREMGFVEVAGWEDSDFWSACLRLTWNSWAQQSHCVVVASHYTTFRVNSAVTSNLGYYGTPTALTRPFNIHTWRSSGNWTLVEGGVVMELMIWAQFFKLYHVRLVWRLFTPSL